MADNKRISDTPKHNYKTNNKQKNKTKNTMALPHYAVLKAAVKSTAARERAAAKKTLPNENRLKTD